MIFHIFIVKQKIYNMNEKEKKVLINVRIEKNIIENYKVHCDKNGYSLSKRIRILINRDLENGIRL